MQELNEKNLQEKDKPEEWINLTEDSGVQKLILKRGYGEIPQSGNTVEINYKLSLEDGTLIEQKEDSVFAVGKGMIIKAWDIGIMSMKKYEIALFKIQPEYGYGKEEFEILHIPANSILLCEIELTKFREEPVESSNTEIKNNMTITEKLKKANYFKEEGVKYFTVQNYYEAIQKFNEGLELLYGEGLNNEARDLMMSLNLNICNCCNKLGYYQHTIDKMDFSLKLRTDHPKIYYYRGIAYAMLDKLQEAEKDYDRLYGMIPSTDAGLIQLKKLIDDKTPKSNNKVFKSMFKAKLYEDVEKENIKKRKNSDDEYSSDEDREINRVKIWDNEK